MENQKIVPVLQGKIVLVTGGTKGTGLEIAKQLYDSGAIVIVTARNEPKHILNGLQFIPADLSTKIGTDKIVHEVLQKYGRLDILINNLGGSETKAGGFSVLTDENWEETIQTNLLAPVRLDRGFLPQMIKNKSGVIIHIGSIQGKLPLHDSTLPYAAAKAGLINYSKGLSKEVSPLGVRVLTVSPGWIMTDSSEKMMERIAESSKITVKQAKQSVMDALGGIPIGRPASPVDIANLISFLVSSKANYLTGSEFIIDGGTIPTI